MMTATDELRRMLTERGVKWESEDCPSFDGKVVYRYTYWGEGNGVTFCEPIGAKPGTLGATCDFSAIGVTPEQAIAATLGVETCSNKRGRCSACGSIMYDAPNYCPNCGRKVVDE